MAHDRHVSSGTAADIARIIALRDAGTLTADEADRLIGVLQELDGSEGSREAESPRAAEGHRAPEPPPAPGPAANGSGAERWLTLALLAGDVRVAAADVAEPEITGDEGEVRLERQAAGWSLRDRGGWTGRSRLRTVHVRLPRGVGVDLDVKAGDVRIEGAPAVVGRMLAGDLRVDGAEHIDVHKAAGDLDARVRLREGTHHVRAHAGDVRVTLLPGSDVAVEATVTVGEVDAPAGFTRRARALAGVATGTVGAGTARLEVRATAGNVRIETEAGDA